VQLLKSPLVERLNFGPVHRIKISSNGPHEEHRFELLYHGHSIELAECRILNIIVGRAV
jgi:hypothetical protein